MTTYQTEHVTAMETSWTNAGSVAVTESLKTTATATATNSMRSVNAEVPAEADDDADGICDDVDDCVGDYDECGICNGPGDIYECGCSDIPEGDCDCDGNVLDECGVCGGDGIPKTTATATATNSMHSVNAEVPVKPTMMLMASATT